MARMATAMVWSTPVITALASKFRQVSNRERGATCGARACEVASALVWYNAPDFASLSTFSNATDSIAEANIG